MAQYNLGTAHGTVEIDADTSGITRAQNALNGLNQNANNASGGLGNLNRSSRAASGGASIAASTIAVMATKLAVATVAGAGVIAIATELTGVLGLLPAIAVAGGLAMGALKIGMSGFGDAMKNAGDPEAFAESLKTLSPEARQTAIALRGLRDEWGDLKESVQDELFRGTAESIQGLAGTYLPMLRGALSTTAGFFSTAFNDIAAQLQTTQRQADMQAIFNASSASVGNLVRAIPPLVSAFIDVAAVAAPILQQITSGAAGGAQEFANFVAKARESGQLGEWIQNGLQAFRDLWTIISLLFGTVTNLVAAFGGPDSLLGVLTMVATALHTVAVFINENQAVIGPLMIAIGAIVALYKIWTLATAAWGAVTAAQTAIANSSILRTVAVQSMAALRWIGNFLLMSAAAIAWVAVQVAQGAIVVARWLINFAIMSAATIAWVAVQIVQAGIVMARWVAMAVVAVAQAAIVAGAWLLTAGANAAIAIAQTLFAAGAIIAQWVLMGVQAMARAAVMAAAWFIALGPIGWAIAALLAVVAFVIIFWDDIKGYFVAAGQFLAGVMQSIWQGIVNVWNTIVGAFRAAGQAIWGAILQMVNWITTGLTNAINFIAALPGRILGIFAAAGSWLINAGRNIISGLVNGISALIGMVGSAAGNAGRAAINAFAAAGSWLVGAGMDLLRGLWNGISRMGSWVYNQVMGWARGLLNGVKSFFGIGSPSRVFAEFGGWLMEGLQIGIDNSADVAVNAAQAAAQGVVDTMTGMLDTGTIEGIIGDSLSDVSLAALVSGTPVAGGTVGTAAATGAGTLGAAVGTTDTAASSAAAGASTHIELNTYNPVAEKASDSEARRIRAAAAVGAF